MNKHDETGLKAETLIYELLKENLLDFDICWTRRERRNNEPFDFEIFGRKTAVLLIEVKAFSNGRKWYWTQFKRPAIKRKKARMKQLNNPLALTVVVRLYKTTAQIRWDIDFPSQPFEDFYAKPSFKQLLEDISYDSLHT
jgi:hypothetical protein